MKYFPLFAGLLAAIATTNAATIPYTNDFSATGDAFSNENGDANWAVSGGSYVFSTNQTNYPALTASNEFINVAGTSFTLQTQFTVTNLGTVNANGETVGFGLFGGDATFTGGSVATAYYLADFNINSSTAGTLRILSQGDGNGFSRVDGLADANSDISSLAIVVDTTYTLRLVGTYVGSTLNMNLSLWDATGTTQIGTSATATDTTPLTGTNFGYRNRIGIQGGTFTTNFDNFSLTPNVIPEPSTAGLALVGALGLTATLYRRRRAAAR